MLSGRYAEGAETLFLQLLILHYPRLSIIFEPLEHVLDLLDPRSVPLFLFQQPLCHFLATSCAQHLAGQTQHPFLAELPWPPRFGISLSLVLRPCLPPRPPPTSGTVILSGHIFALSLPPSGPSTLQPVEASPGTCCSPPGPPFPPTWLHCPADSLRLSRPVTSSMLRTSQRPLLIFPDLRQHPPSPSCWQHH